MLGVKNRQKDPSLLRDERTGPQGGSAAVVVADTSGTAGAAFISVSGNGPDKTAAASQAHAGQPALLPRMSNQCFLKPGFNQQLKHPLTSAVLVQGCSLGSLPLDVLTLLLSQLTAQQQATLRLVCKRLLESSRLQTISASASMGVYLAEMPVPCKPSTRSSGISATGILRHSATSQL